MWIRSHSKVYSGIQKEHVWKIWTDINNWGKWQSDLDYCKIESDFKVGNHFMLKPKGAPAVKIRLIDINEGNSFTDCTSFLGVKMWDTHSLEQTPEGLKITNTVRVTGPLRWLWVKLVAKNVADTSPAQLGALVKLVKEKHV